MQPVGNTCWNKIDLLYGFVAGCSKQTLGWRGVKRTSIIACLVGLIAIAFKDTDVYLVTAL
jgi:hypothetical protein